MASYVARALGAIATAGVFVLSGASPSDASVTMGDCTITALSPSPVVVTDVGRKVSVARASVRCTTAHYVDVALYLYGDDPVFDDLTETVIEHNVAVGPVSRTLGEVKRNWQLYRGCNEDVGNDELYSRVKIRIRTVFNGPASAWSAWERGATVTYYC